LGVFKLQREGSWSCSFQAQSCMKVRMGVCVCVCGGGGRGERGI
jgi:hypothetical protein